MSVESAIRAPSWEAARVAAFEAGAEAVRPVVELPLGQADGATLARPLRPRTDLPAFPTCSVDGWAARGPGPWRVVGDRKSTRLNSSHEWISYAVFCLKKK